MTEASISWLQRLDPSRLAGPILLKELRTTSRRRRTYFLRGGYLAALALFVLAVWTQVAPRGVDLATISQMADAGRYLIQSILVFQFLALQGVAIILLSAAFSGEVHRQTLPALLVSPISEFQILAGKLGSGVLQVLMLLLCSLPMLAIARVFGGVPWDQVRAGSAVTACSVLLAGALAVHLSTIFRQSLVVMVLAAVGAAVYWMVAWVFLVLVLHWLILNWLSRILQADPRSPSVLRSVAQALVSLVFVLSFVPLLGAAIYLTAVASEYASPFVAIVQPGPSSARSAGSTTCVCLLSLLAAWLVLRRAQHGVVQARRGILFGQEYLDSARYEQLTGSMLRASGVMPSPAPAPAAAPAGPADEPTAGAPAGQRDEDVAPSAARRRRRLKPPNFYERLGSPIVWKDCNGPLLRSEGIQVLLIVLPLTVGLGLYLGALLEGTFRYAEAHLEGVIYPFLAGGLLLTALLASTCVSAERQSRMWPALLTTCLSDWHILWAKSAAVFWRCRYLWLALMLHLAGFALAGVLHAWTLPLVAALVLSWHVFLTGLGAYLGTRTRTNATALLIMVALAGLLWIVLPNAMLPLRHSDVEWGEQLAEVFTRLSPAWLARVAVHGQDYGFHATRYVGLPGFESDGIHAAWLTLQAVLLYVGLGGLLGWRACRRFRKCAF